MSSATDKTNLTISVDKPTRESFSRLCEGLGLSVSSCIIAMMKQAVRQQSVTFSLLDENGVTPSEARELRRRADEAMRGHTAEHELIED